MIWTINNEEEYEMARAAISNWEFRQYLALQHPQLQQQYPQLQQMGLQSSQEPLKKT
jgi:hypothetical protein